MSNVILWLVVGGFSGWIASSFMHTEGQHGTFLNVVAGVLGAALGGWLISPLVGLTAMHREVFSVGDLMVSLMGASILLAVANLFHRGAVH